MTEGNDKAKAQQIIMTEGKDKARAKSPVINLPAGSTETDRLINHLKSLSKKRGNIRCRLTMFKKYLTKYNIGNLIDLNSLEIKELTLRLAQTQDLLREFDSIQSNIEELSDNIEEQLNERLITENEYFPQIAFAQDIIDSLTNNTIQSDKNITQSEKNICCGNNNSINFPTINLPTFDGNHTKWLEFRDTFESLVNQNRHIAAINKFHYLRNSLIGSANVAIRSIEFADANYELAWRKVCDRYNNKNTLINNHLSAIVNLQPLQKATYGSLRYVADIVDKNLSSLNSLDISTDNWDPLVIFIISEKLDQKTKGKWVEYKGNMSHQPTLTDFNNFLEIRMNVLGGSTSGNPTYHENKTTTQFKNNTFNNKPKTNIQSYTINNNPTTGCVICDQQHFIYYCPKFTSMSIDNRVREVSKLKLCANCLRSVHNITQCPLKGSCKVCRSKHNTLLHQDNSPGHSSTAEDRGLIPTMSNPVSLTAFSPGQVLLCTAQVEVTNTQTQLTALARILLDTGSQSSFMTTNLKEKLGLKSQPIQFKVSGINNVECRITERCSVNIKSRINNFQIQVNCLVIPKITGDLPGIPVDVARLNLPEDIVLADPLFFDPSQVDVLVGADHFFEIISNHKLNLGPNRPILQSSALGWLVAGPTGDSYNQDINKQESNIQCNVVHDDSIAMRSPKESVFLQEINNTLQRFWEVEELPSDTTMSTLTLDEQFCESHFKSNTRRLPNGRFQVSLPLKEDPELALGNSFPIAMKRFFTLERKLHKNPNINQQYTNFIQEYSDLGHLTQIKKPPFGFYLPHHCVIREQHETTKLRVVFDASIKTSTGKSLNDIQAVGPVVQSDLFSILIRFRLHKYVLTADIEKMYRQILVEPSQRHLQLVVWRDLPCSQNSIYNNDTFHSEDAFSHETLQTLRLNTVTYGTASAPFLSTRCLVELAEQCQDKVIANVIKNDFYIDDLNTGAATATELKHIYQNVTKILDSACFPLRKFRTNCPKILSSIAESSKSLEFHDQTTILGLKWTPKDDTLHFSSDISTPTTITKRTIISTTCKLFDPLGLVSCCIIKPKIILQQLWSAKLGWDDLVPADLVKNWLNFINNLHHLSNITLPRYTLGSSSQFQFIELHCYVDASQQAYGSCIFMRTLDTQSNMSVRLLCAKSRVAPIKQLTIPRLELCAALLGAELSRKVLNSIPCKVTKVYMWTDSTIVLGWRKMQNKTLLVFVRNRIIKLNEISQDFEWRHVPSELNPADLASRGVDPQHLQSAALWWNGPSYLQEPKDNWPTQPINIPTDLPETKSLTVNNLLQPTPNSFIQFERFSNFNKLRRTFAYVSRFINNCNLKRNKLSGPLQTDELNQSLAILIKYSQQQSFSVDIQCIKTNNKLHHKSKLLPLNPFLDSDDIIRVGGRIHLSDVQYDKKHPILLDSKHILTKLLMSHEHIRLFHAGPQLLLSSVREKFWPLGGRQLARNIVRKCIVCTRMKGRTLQPIMGDLPNVRVTPNFPFHSCGTDFAGPFMISSKKGKGNRISKAYLCIFVCLVTKALHLEVVSDLTTEAFILCLRRFVSRRGKPYVIYCDNGKNFVGAKNELGRVLKSSRHQVSDYAADEDIKFMFCPAYSPHFGGIWEAGVKSAKFHLKRVAGNTALTFEELSTFFTQIEAILNSRPITPISSDPSDLNPLTPGHFLIGRPLMSVPSLPVTSLRPDRYRRIEQLRQHFWERWRREFMAELQNRTKWRRNQSPLNIGDMVILKEDNVMPLHWRMGRVTKLYPGNDGMPRVADVYTSRGTIKRAVNKMCLLPIDEAEERSPTTTLSN